jgi:hypothetical protein
MSTGNSLWHGLWPFLIVAAYFLLGLWGNWISSVP